jgi:carbon-monoxide dehydrogenase medium subunit
VYPSPFEYAAPASLAEAIALLQEHGDEAKLLAGGHSLLPLMKLRLAAPSILIDLGRVPDLTGIGRQNGPASRSQATIELGALTTYAAVISSSDLRQACPLLAETAAHVGDTQVRNRGTVGGAAAHADPAGDIPAALLALDASFSVAGADGARRIRARDFFLGPFTTDLHPDEVLTRISIPSPAPRTGTAYEKFRNPASGYAIVGIAALIALDEAGAVANARVAVTGLGAQPVRASGVEDALRGQVPDEAAIATAAERVTDGPEVLGDMHGSAEYRSHLARVYARRALTRAVHSI